MINDFDSCYRAVQSRDARFDGRFFTAVTSTGIYCRPICPARTPLEANVRFYARAAAAEAAGFRACRRCHPEQSPEAPEHQGNSSLVARALRLIAEGMVDAEGVGGLARALEVSERHLHRSFVEEIGVGPLALARTRRAQTARLLIDRTSMPLTNIAAASGFSSLRQFNETMQASFGCNPTELRRKGASVQEGAGWLTLRLHYRPPFDGPALLDWLARRAIPGVEEVAGETYRRTIVVSGSRGIIELRPIGASNIVRLRLQLEDMTALATAVQRCRHLLDLDSDPDAVNAVLRDDSMLAPLVAQNPGLRVPGTTDGWELAVRAILGQQVSVAGARALAAALVRTLGELLSQASGSLTHKFPDPRRLVSVDPALFGLPRTRALALQSLAAAVVAGDITLDRGADRERTLERLGALRGIGPWTASYIAMRALGDPNALPASDLGLRRAFEQRGMNGAPDAITERAAAWQPWRAYAVHHLWQSLSHTPQKRTDDHVHRPHSDDVNP